MAKPKIIISKNGPYIVSGKLPLSKEIIETGPSNEPEKWLKGGTYPESNNYSLCRCGQSKKKPFCDGSHIKAVFDGTETASAKKYAEGADKTEGPGVDLTDNKALCSLARFCHPHGGTWQLTKRSDDPASKKLAIEQACSCPSGRLVAWDNKAGKAIEPQFGQSISVTEDPQAGVSGPLWVKGGVPVESENGTKYEIRNRVTLCRCGKSRNKPFCDGSHIAAKFNDNDSSLGR